MKTTNSLAYLVGDTNKNNNKFLVITYVLYTLIFGFIIGYDSFYNESPSGILGFLSNHNIRLLIQVCIIGIVFYNFNKHNSFIFQKGNGHVFLFFICYIIYILLGRRPNLWGYFSMLLTLIPIVLYLCFTNNLKIQIFECLINILSLLLLLGIFEYIIKVFTDYTFVISDQVLYLGDRPYIQGVFNIFPKIDFPLWGLYFNRFQGLAEEPGGLGTVCGFLLFATSGCARFKWQYIIFWISGILSFSLAFYVIGIIHILSTLRDSQNTKYLLACIIIFVVLYYYFQDVFDVLIRDRFFDDDIDNRSSSWFNNALTNAWNNGSLWWYRTVSDRSVLRGTAGVKLALYEQGIIAVFFLIIGYIYEYFTFIKQHKRCLLYGMTFFIVFWLSYYQRQYIFMMQYVIPYFTMPLFLDYKNCINTINSQQT